MSPVRNARCIFSAIPNDIPQPDVHSAYDASRTIDLDEEPLNGGFLVKTIGLSVDPYMRAKMRDPRVLDYVPAYIIGEPIYGFGLGRVLRSENPAFKPGDHIYGGTISYEEYFVCTDATGLSIIENKLDLPWSVYLSVLGIVGQTSYVGWKEFSKAKKGDTLFITAAASGVGTLVIQLAKMDGVKVIASSGSDEKAALARSLGADVSFNYKTQSTKEVLDREGPIDIYWDHVGGEMLDLALDAAVNKARFIECGMASTWNNGGKSYVMTHLIHIVTKQICMNGLAVYEWLGKHGEAFWDEVPQLVKDGKLRYKEDISYGLESFGRVMYEVMTGKNEGKSIILLEH